MKLFLMLGLMSLSFALCNVTERFSGLIDSDGGDKSTETSGGSSEGAGDVKKATLSAEQEKLLDENIKWEEQGLSWRLPKGWKEMSKSRNSLNYGSPDNAFLLVNISPMSSTFPVDASVKAYYDGQVTRMKNGEVREVQYTEIDGVKGVEFVESSPEDGGDPQRHQWIGYRTYGDQVQMLNVMLSTRGSNFEKHEDEFQAILYSTGIVK